MKTPNMKKKPTRSKCFSYVLFMMASNWVYYRLTELYFSGTEAAEPKIITTSTEYGSVRKNIVYSKNYSHSLSHYYYLLYYKQCLFTKDISSIMSGLETKKKTFDQIYKNLFVNSSKRQSQELDFRRWKHNSKVVYFWQWRNFFFMPLIFFLSLSLYFCFDYCTWICGLKKEDSYL